MSEFFHNLFVKPAKHYLIAFAIGAVITGLLLLLWGTEYLLSFINAFGVSGGLLLFGSALILVADWGAFDTIGYGFSTFGKRRYKDLVEYKEAKEQKRRGRNTYVLPYFLIGVVFLVVSILIDKLH